MVGHTRVLDFDSVVIDAKRTRSSACILAVADEVGNDFTENTFSQAYAHVAFEIEGVIEVFINKAHQLLVCLNQVGANRQAIIITFGILATQKAIELVSRGNALYDVVTAKKKQTGQRIAGTPCIGIFADKATNLNQAIIIERTLRINQRIITPTNYTALRELFAEFTRRDQRALLFFRPRGEI